METQNLRRALELLREIHRHKEYHSLIDINEDNALLEAANRELNELQRLAEAVKGFIDDRDVKKLIGNLVEDGYIETPEFIKDICDIVGYKE